MALRNARQIYFSKGSARNQRERKKQTGWFKILLEYIYLLINNAEFWTGGMGRDGIEKKATSVEVWRVLVCVEEEVGGGAVATRKSTESQKWDV